MSYRHLASLLTLVLLSPVARAQEEKAFRLVTPALVEKALKRANFEFAKTANTKPNTYLYDFKSRDLNLRLYYLDGARLMVDTLLAAMPLEKVNEWNLSAKFTRAGLGKDDKGAAYTVLESHFNLRGGITVEAVKEFITAFIDELGQYQLFVRESGSKDLAKEEQTFQEVSPALMEKILDDLKIKYVKASLGSGRMSYVYDSKDTKITLTSWGKDMMLEARFAKLPLAKVNQYNLDRKFIRAVSYSNKRGDYTTLEANLNFTGGVTESIVRNFVTVFEEDAEGFGAYVRKMAEKRD